jgi:superfamily II DNA helicase RecQ
MIEYADTSSCLRATILRYFGDAAARDRCDACGNCRPGTIDAYEHELVRKILSGILLAGEPTITTPIVLSSCPAPGRRGALPPAGASLAAS